MNRAAYPPTWTALVAAVRERSGNRCEAVLSDGERCPVENHTWLHRAIADPERIYGCAALGRDCTGRDVTELYPEPVREAPIYVRLTTAHAVGVPSTCGDLDKLSYLCELHHNRMDMPMRQKHAAASRHQQRLAALRATGQTELAFGEGTARCR